MVTRTDLISALTRYHSPYPEEKEFLSRFHTLLEHPRAFYKDHLPGHITGSAFIIDHNGLFTLLTLHAKLKKWLQPGGHADGEENILNVAIRETEEETGVKKIEIAEGIFDIDIHPIPAFNGFPQHDHYDIRFLFRASMEDTVLISDESFDVAWKPLANIPQLTANNPSMVRLMEKVNALFGRNK